MWWMLLMLVTGLLQTEFASLLNQRFAATKRCSQIPVGICKHFPELQTSLLQCYFLVCASSVISQVEVHHCYFGIRLHCRVCTLHF